MKLYQKVIIGLVLVILLGSAIFVVSAILPDRAYKAITSSNDLSYVYIYPHKIVRIYQDLHCETHCVGDSQSTMLIDSSTSINEQEALVLKYAKPGEKGASYRESLTMTDTSADYNGVTYSRTTPWLIFVR